MLYNETLIKEPVILQERIWSRRKPQSIFGLFRLKGLGKSLLRSRFQAPEKTVHKKQSKPQKKEMKLSVAFNLIFLLEVEEEMQNVMWMSSPSGDGVRTVAVWRPSFAINHYTKEVS